MLNHIRLIKKWAIKISWGKWAETIQVHENSKIIPYCSNLKCYDYDGVDYVKRKNK